MKVIMENWKIYEQQMLWEQEFEQFFNNHFILVEEGVTDAVDWVIDKGSQVKDTVVNVIAGMKDWAHEKIVDFVRYMGGKLQQFIATLVEKGIFGKYEGRTEKNAVGLLMTNKHMDLAVMVFSAIAKLTGGFVVTQAAASSKIVKTVFDLLEDPIVAFKELVGDVSDIVDIIKKFMDYRKDKKSLAANMGQWADFGGLAEDSGGLQ